MKTGWRHIKSGRQFDHLFPTPMGENVLLKNNAILEDTLDLMHKAIAQTLEDTVSLAALLEAKDPRKTCQNIWNFCFQNIQYKEDEQGTEQVRRPARSWWDRKRGVDCDCLSVFIGSILTNLNIPFSLRLTRYKKPHFEHVYPIAHLNDQDIIIDAVVHGFNREVPYTEKKDIDMKLEYLNGFDDDDQLVDQILDDDIPMDAQAFVFEEDLDGLEGRAERQARRAKRKADRKAKGKTTFKEKLKKGLHIVNRLNPGAALLRAGILVSMKLNLMKVASKLRFSYWSSSQASQNNMDMSKYNHLRSIREKLEKIFFGAGGKPENMKKSILSGKGNRDRAVVLNGLGSVIQPVSDEDDLITILGEDIYADEFEQLSDSINGIDGLGSATAAGAAITAASGVIATIASLIKKLGSLFKKGSAQQEQETIQDNTDEQEEKTRKFSIKNIAQKLSESGAALPAITAKSGQVIPAENTPSMIEPSFEQIEKQTDTRNDENEDEDEPQEKGIIAWVKKHPIPTAGIAVGTGLGIYLLARYLKQQKEKKAKQLSGVKKPKRKKKPTTSSTVRRKRKPSRKTTRRRKSSTAKSKKVQKVKLL